MQSGKRTRHTPFLFTLLPIILMTLTHVHGDDLDTQQKSLNIIGDFAERICTSIPLEVEGKKVELSGEAKAGLNELLSKIGNLGIKGVAKYQNEASKGPLREELAQSIKNSDDCRLDVFNKLIDRLLPLAKPQGEAPLSAPRPRVEQRPPPYSPPEPKSDVVQADGATVTAEEFVRLTSSNLSSQVNISDHITFPFCTVLGIARNERDLRQFLGVDTATLSQMGRIIVTARDIMRVREYTILNTIGRPDNFRRDKTSTWCKEQRVIFDNDYVVGVLRQHVDVQQVFLFDVVIDWRSGLVKGIIQ